MAKGEVFVIEDTGSETNKSHTVSDDRELTGSPTLEQGDWSGSFSTPELTIPNDSLIVAGYSDFLRASGTARSLSKAQFYKTGVLGAYTEDVLSDDPFYFYKLRETDLSGQNLTLSGYDGVANVGGTLVGDGLIDEYADALEGDSWEITVVNNSAINTESTAPARSLETITRIDDTSTLQCIYEQGGGSRGLSLSIDSGSLYFNGWNNVSSDGPGDDWGHNSTRGDVGTSVSIPSSGTYYIACVYVQETGDDNYDGELRLYIGDVTDTLSGLTSASATSNIGKLYAHSGDAVWCKNSNAFIGSAQGNTSPASFDGALNGIAYYDTELTPDRISSHFQSCDDEDSPVVGDPPGLVGIKGVTSDGYNRNAGGADESSRHGTYVDVLGNNDKIKVIEGTSLGTSDRVGDYDRTAGDPRGLWAIDFGDSNYLFASISSTDVGSGRYRNSPRPIDLGTPSALSEGTWKQVTFDTTDDSSGSTITRSSATFTIAANSKVLCFLNYQVLGVSDRNNLIMQMNVDGSPYAYSSIYNRDGNSDEVNGSITMPIITSSSAVDVEFYFVDQSEDTGVGEIDIQQCSARFIDVTSQDLVLLGKTDSDITSITGTTQQISFPVADEIQVDSSFDHPSGNLTRISNNAGETITVLAGFTVFTDRSATSSGTRKEPGSQLRKTGSLIDYAIASEMNRGQQSGDDCFVAGYSFCAPVELGSGDYLELDIYDLAGNAASDLIVNCTDDKAIYFWAIRLDDMETEPITYTQKIIVCML